MKLLIIDVPEIFEDENKTILFGNITQEREIRRFNQAKGIGYSFIKNRDLSDVKPTYREIFNGIDNKFAKDLLMPEKLLVETIEGAAKYFHQLCSSLRHGRSKSSLWAFDGVCY